jgi:hypothetical protein
VEQSLRSVVPLREIAAPLIDRRLHCWPREQHRGSGAGANIIAMPSVNFGGDFRMPGLAFVQFARRMH